MTLHWSGLHDDREELPVLNDARPVLVAAAPRFYIDPRTYVIGIFRRPLFRGPLILSLCSII